eukprot:g16437.t1
MAVDGARPTQSLGCSTQARGSACGSRSQTNTAGRSSSLGSPPTLEQSQVFDHEGESLQDRNRTSLLLLAMPIVKALGGAPATTAPAPVAAPAPAPAAAVTAAAVAAASPSEATATAAQTTARGPDVGQAPLTETF